MRNLKALAFMALAVMLGLAAAVYAANWVGRQGGIASNKVVVASVDVQLGNRLNAQMLTTVDWPSSSIPTGAFRDVKEVEERVLRTAVLRGEPILDGKLAPLGTQGGLSAVIAEGKRAMTVRVNDVVGVAGFALPGNYVDVVVSAQQTAVKGEEPRQISKTVLEHVLVLAVAQEASRDDTKPKVVNAVTLELSLEDAEKLDLARSVGTLSLVLRNQMDKKMVATKGMTKDELWDLKQPLQQVSTAPAPAAAKPQATRARPTPVRSSECVEVIHAQRTLSCF